MESDSTGVGGGLIEDAEEGESGEHNIKVLQCIFRAHSPVVTWIYLRWYRAKAGGRVLHSKMKVNNWGGVKLLSGVNSAHVL